MRADFCTASARHSPHSELFMDRRDFLRTATVAAGLAAAEPLLANAAAPEPPTSEMIYRALGRTGEHVSAIGLGGYHIGKHDLDEAEAIRLMHQAIDRGINFLDNCWDYNGGVSEERMGKALAEGRRQKVFLMSKIDGRTKAEAARQIDDSLRRLGTDRIDLMQFHEVIRLEDPDRIFAEGGALEAILEAQKAGKIRYIGFTGHKDPYVLLRILEAARAHNFHFDAAQMPLNVMDAHFRSFEQDVLPVLVREGIAPLGMKAFGDHYILTSNTVQPIECLHYCLNLPISVQITGIDNQATLDQAFEAVRTFKPFTAGERASLLARTKDAAMAGRFELYKTTSNFDGTAHNPKWLG
jgi:diketogulonate reductase-like aldo/keto reductase